MIPRQFPLTTRALSSLSDGDAVLAHLASLEDAFGNRNRIAISSRGGPGRGVSPAFDVALAGGGLSLLYGAYLQRAGLKVAIFDRRRIGCGHREWNISRAELQPLITSGLFSAAEIERLVKIEYDHGIVRWHGGGTYRVRKVLDCVIDADWLLGELRARAAGAGAMLFDEHALVGYQVGAGGVRVELQHRAETVSLTARLLIDAMGAASPHATFDLACPTVGGVLAGLDEGSQALSVDPTVGEILVTTEGVEAGRQHIWEGFPQPGSRFTTYLFYYTEPDSLSGHPLFELYERFFATRERYKRGAALLERATYGFIPAYSRLSPMPSAPADRVILVGDAAGRHSPLTFCGFGSMVRSFLPVARELRRLLAEDRLDRRALCSVWQEPPALQVMGALTLMMVPGRLRSGSDPAEVNQLLDAAFASLAELGEETFAAFVRDEIGFADFLDFMRRTAARHPTIYREVFERLSKLEVARWSLGFARLGWSEWRRRRVHPDSPDRGSRSSRA